MKNFIVLMLICLAAGFSMKSNAGNSRLLMHENVIKRDTATFASGCFWCVEAKFSQLKGVFQVIAGYTGGQVKNPTYAQVCSGNTGHAEACQIIYDPNQITFDELLEAFFLSHDPTQLNRQGNDVGTQYRSAIFYHNAKQKERANYYLHKLAEQKVYKSPVVTQLSGATKFYKAEGYHQGYFNKNPNDIYCRMVIEPEMKKFKAIFKDKLK